MLGNFSGAIKLCTKAIPYWDCIYN